MNKYPFWKLKKFKKWFSLKEQLRDDMLEDLEDCNSYYQVNTRVLPKLGYQQSDITGLYLEFFGW